MTVPDRLPTLAVLAGLAFWFGDGFGLPTHALAAEGSQSQLVACATAPLENLKRLCPVPSEVLSGECLAALETRYARRPVYCDLASAPRDWWGPPRWRPLPRKEILAWGDVFEDASTVRGKVEAAVRNPACRLREHEFRAGLRQPCAADAMARLAALQRACVEPLAREDEANPYFHGWPLVWAEHRAVVEEHGDENYWQLIADLEETELHFAWRMTKCRAVPKLALEKIPMLLPPSHWGPQDQHNLLMGAAARLGSPWAIAMAGAATHATDAVAIEQWTDAPLPLALVSLADQTSRGSLSYLLAARGEDLQSETPWFDWRGFEQAFSAEVIRAARPAAERIRAQGWPPCCKPQRGDSPWPWTDLPTVVRTEYIRQRIDEKGNVRQVYRSGGEEWVEDGRVYTVKPDGEELIGFDHSRILRRWTDVDGTERWVDEWGTEHWLDADGREHWIRLDGTEWILLPVGEPFPPESAEPQ